ncbi:MAG: DUF3341 domain-containing protein [Oligoflexia bacterium]|nr:DUF3341 domain-containing protein [Oligoflexia bacterium]
MPETSTAVYGIFKNEAQSELAVDHLKKAGFRNSDISALFPSSGATRDLAHERHTKAPEGAAAGCGTGAFLGGTLGWLAGIGAITIPAVGPFIAAGPLMALLAGMGAGGMVGSLAGTLIGLGIPEYEAKLFEGRIRNGGLLLSVHCEAAPWAKRAEEILKQAGAEDVSSKAEAPADEVATGLPKVVAA